MDNLKSDIYNTKKEEVLNLIKEFHIASKNIITRYLNGDSQLSGRILGNLVRAGKIATKDNEIFVSHKNYLSNINELLIYKKLLLLMVVLKEHNEIGTFVFPEDNFIKLTFEANGELFDIVYVKYGQENSVNRIVQMKERYLAPEDKDALNRIVLIDDKEQIKRLNINGTKQFVTITSNEDVSIYTKD